MKEEWSSKPLGELVYFQRGLTYSKNDEVETSNNIVLRATNIDLSKNKLDFTELKYISESVLIPDTKKVRKGSIMICTASGSKSHLGKVAYIDDDYDYAFGGFMGMITPKSMILAKYLFYLMTSDIYRQFIDKLSEGMNINNLKYEELKLFPIPFPDLPEQHRVIGILDKAFADLAKAKALAEKKCVALDELGISILHQAFSGQL